jgi:hypothetical protein
MDNMNAFVVRGESGSVDVEATTLKFRGALEVYLATRETEDASIAAAVHEVFDTHRGANINMPALVGFAIQKLGVTPANHATLSEKVADYVRNNAGDGGAFEIKKGKGGGTRRVCDITKPAAK